MLQNNGVEIQPQLADRARRGAELNGLANQIEIINGTFAGEGPFRGGRYSLMVAIHHSGVGRETKPQSGETHGPA